MKTILGSSGAFLLLACLSRPAVAQVPHDEDEAQFTGTMRAVLRDRPRQAEMAARAYLYTIAPADFRPAPATNGPLDSLKRLDEEDYWRIVAELTAHFERFQRLIQQDTVRAALAARLAGASYKVHLFTRLSAADYRAADEAGKQRMRARLVQLVSERMDAELLTHAMNLQDAVQRLDRARARYEDRRQRRAVFEREFVESHIRAMERNLY